MLRHNCGALLASWSQTVRPAGSKTVELSWLAGVNTVRPAGGKTVERPSRPAGGKTVELPSWHVVSALMSYISDMFIDAQ